jgi:hypothetical protein
MDVQASNKGGFANNLPLQMGLLVIAAVIVIALAWKFLW